MNPDQTSWKQGDQGLSLEPDLGWTLFYGPQPDTAQRNNMPPCGLTTCRDRHLSLSVGEGT